MALDKVGTDLGTKVAFKTSNPKVATVTFEDNEAVVTATGRGTATITATAQDGSGRSASVRITVLQLAESITITGQSSIARGNRATYRATVLPTNANNKKVNWYLVDPGTGKNITPEGVTINSSTGVVTVDKQAEVDMTTIGVMAAAADNGAGFSSNPTKSEAVSFMVSSVKASQVKLYADVNTVINPVHNIPESYTGSTTINSFRLYDTDIPDTGAELKENQIRLTRTVSSTSGKQTTDLTDQTGVTWTSSNPKVAVVEQEADGNAVVIAVKTGSATISCTAMDGSGRKANVRVTVIKPASGIDVTVGAGLYKPANAPYYIGYGASHTVKCALGTEYGKPTVSGYTWDYEIGFYTNKGFVKIDDQYKTYYRNNRLFFGFSGGRITANTEKACEKAVEKFKQKYPEYEFPKGDRAIRVIARTTDGTGYEAEKIFRLTEPVKRFTVYIQDDGEFVEATGCDMLLSAGHKVGYIDITATSDKASRVNYCSVTSNKPSVATAATFYEKRSEYGTKARTYLDIYAHGKGTARLTIKALDGSGKTYGFTVRVK